MLKNKLDYDEMILSLTTRMRSILNDIKLFSIDLDTMHREIREKGKTERRLQGVSSLEKAIDNFKSRYNSLDKELKDLESKRPIYVYVREVLYVKDPEESLDEFYQRINEIDD